jgi:alpha-mannosidase
MRVTLLRSPAYAHHDRRRYDASRPFSIMDQGWHTIRIWLVPHAGPWQDASVPRRAWELNEPLFVHAESAHKGTLPARASFLECDAPNVLLSVLKKSEDGGDVIVRGYETHGRAVNAVIRVQRRGRVLRAAFAPHEIKTLRVNPKTGAVVEVNLLEEPAKT